MSTLPPAAVAGRAPLEPGGETLDPGRLVDLFQRKYAVLLLSELARRDGAKLVTLVHGLGASPGAVRVTLDDLMERGWVMRNPGYGHPLRPEYVLTPEGARLAARCARLDDLLRKRRARAMATKKWTMPALFAIGRRRARFSEISAALDAATDRAVSLALHDLGGARLVSREVTDGRPPASVYRATAGGIALLGPLAELL